MQSDPMTFNKYVEPDNKNNEINIIDKMNCNQKNIDSIHYLNKASNSQDITKANLFKQII